ncbi:hypothetical protein K501DRAFT_249839 [Backusella circina FSU 941]|nr:hypothetical protein K501DRAFT_249839 [Backusella circina FSU 941]
MSASPQKALIIYCPSEANVAIPSIDQLTKLGCSGSLLLESENKDEGISNDIFQILGLNNRENEGASEVYSKRFNKLKLTIISNNTPTKDIAKSLSCELHELKNAKDVKQLISQNSESDCFLVDMTAFNNPWILADQIIKECIDSTPDLLKCVVTPAIGSYSNKQGSFWWDELVPQQSCLIKDGVVVDVNQKRFLVCSYLHVGSTRTDNATEFNTKDIVENGCNKAILAWHYLAEIGHKLGFVPKYGA